jgi:DNA modification methylase
MNKPYYKDKYVTIYNADCLEIIPHLGKVGLLLTDPPYGIGQRSGTISVKRNRNNYIGYDDTKENIRDIVIPAIKLALNMSDRAIITPGGRCAFMYPEPTDIGMIYQPAATGMTYWGRTTCQPILFYGKDPFSGKTIKPIHYQLTERPESNGHPCPKPIGFINWCVSRGSCEGEIVLDPFAGSGTTGRACKDIGRQVILIEKEEKYCEISAKRMGQEIMDFS